MKFVEELMTGMIWIDQLREFTAQHFDLFVIEGANPGEITIRVEEFDLGAGKSILVPVFAGSRPFEESGDRVVMS